jgi:hypothetical protein
MKALLFALALLVSTTLHAKEEKPCPYRSGKGLFAQTAATPATVAKINNGNAVNGRK